MDDVFTYIVDLPVDEMVVPCEDGYTVYISGRLSKSEQEQAYLHAIRHINSGDFDSVYDVQKVELKAHEGEQYENMPKLQ